MNPLQILVALLIFVGGALLGWAVHQSPQGKAPVAAQDLKSSGAGQLSQEAKATEEKILRARVIDLEQQVTQLKEGTEKAVMADRMAFFKKHSFLPSGGNYKFGNPMSDATMDLLRITPSENEGIKKAFLDTRAKIDALKAAHLNIQTNTPESLVFQITPYPEGPALKQELQENLASLLGKDRQEVLQKLKDHLRESIPNDPFMIDSFGEETITVTISYPTNASDPRSSARYWEVSSKGWRKESYFPLSSGQVPQDYRNIVNIKPEGTP